MFTQKVAWVTGASSGIGEALVQELSRQGALVVLSARNKVTLEQVQKNCGLTELNSLVLPLDMEKPEACQAAAEAVVSRFGRIDYLFNNAGISQRSPVADTPLEVIQKVMTINFMSVVALTKAVLPYFLKQQSGHFIITSSLVGKFGTPMRSAYSASKHALHGFFESLRAEIWRQGIKVTLVCPGYIKTSISVNAVKADGKAYGKMDENQSNGMEAVECARQMLAAVAKGKKEVLIGGKETMAVYLKRFFPSLLWRSIRNLNIK